MDTPEPNLMRALGSLLPKDMAPPLPPVLPGFTAPPFDGVTRDKGDRFAWWSWNPTYPYWSKSCHQGDTIEKAIESAKTPAAIKLRLYHNKLIEERDGVLIEVLDVPHGTPLETIALANGIGVGTSTGDDERFARESLPSAPVGEPQTLAGMTKEWFQESASIEGESEIGAGTIRPLLRVITRPLLTDGSLRVDPDGVVTILLRDDLPPNEIPVTLWHEVIHLLRSVGRFDQSEDDVERYAIALAAGFPEIVAWVGLKVEEAKPEAVASDTPRCDARSATSRGNVEVQFADYRELARTLERELAQANAANRSYLVRVAKDAHHIAQLEQDIGRANAAVGAFKGILGRLLSGLQSDDGTVYDPDMEDRVVEARNLLNTTP